MKLAKLLEKYLDGMDVIAVKRYGSEYIVMYHDGRNVCTPYIIHHLNDSGLYKFQGVVYCLDTWFLDVAIQEIGEERLKKYLRGE